MIPSDAETLVMTNLEPFNKDLKNTREYVNRINERNAEVQAHSGLEILNQ